MISVFLASSGSLFQGTVDFLTVDQEVFQAVSWAEKIVPLRALFVCPLKITLSRFDV
jgi:hypothetical protein